MSIELTLDVYNKLMVSSGMKLLRVSGGVVLNLILCFVICCVLLTAVTSTGAAPTCEKWDYREQGFAFNPAGQSHNPYAAFDGYPSDPTQPAIEDVWATDAPKPGSPVSVVLDYLSPVSVTRYVHRYEDFSTPYAWRDVDILTSDDGASWKLLQSFADLPADCPQVLPIDNPKPSRYYRIDVKALAEGAKTLQTQELETYYGPTIGSVTCKPGMAIQTETCRVDVRIVSPDAKLDGAVVRLLAPKGAIAETGPVEAQLQGLPRGGGRVAEFKITPLANGMIPCSLELRLGKQIIDKRPFNIRVKPKLAFADIAPAGTTVTAPNGPVTLTGVVTNQGSKPARDVTVTWMGKKADLGSLAPGKSANIKLGCVARPGYSEGALVASASGSVKTTIRRAIICRANGEFDGGNEAARFQLKANGGVAIAVRIKGVQSPMTGQLQMLVSGQPSMLIPIGRNGAPGALASVIPGGTFLAEVDSKPTENLTLACSVVPDDPAPVDPASWADVEFQVAVDKPKVMFRPHMDWYKVEDGPNIPFLTNAHNNTTRMLCIQTDRATMSMVPSTDNLTWGFTEDNKITAAFRIPLVRYEPYGLKAWRPIDEAPRAFSIRLVARKGDWWDAFHYVTTKIFNYTQPRQWTMPITQVQMLSARYMMSAPMWSERSQTVKAYPRFEFFFHFYGTPYSLPTLYSWYLATDDLVAKGKAEKVAEWSLKLQQKEGPLAGSWFSQYGHLTAIEDPPIGRDQAWNRWVLPHTTGAISKTLLWYWNASGRADQRIFDSAKRGCDWLLSTQRPDGGWPYAFDLDGKVMTEFGVPQKAWPRAGWSHWFTKPDKDTPEHLSDAGQIWNAWALWEMWKATGDTRYKEAAIKFRDYFKANFMDNHRYQGYWEDMNAGKGRLIFSWEGFEAGLAAMVFSDMGEHKLAEEAAKDGATWTWTRVISTRQYQSCYGETLEQGFGGPAQAQCPTMGLAFQRVYETTGNPMWSDYAGTMKAMNTVADPDYAYGMTDNGGWIDPLHGVVGAHLENIRKLYSGQPGVWISAQFAYYALEWLIREGNIRAPGYFDIDADTLRGTVLGHPGRVRMPEEKIDITGMDHYDINWTGYQNLDNYALLVMNHKEKVTVAIRPHEAHLGVYTRAPRVLVGDGKAYRETKVAKKGVQYLVDIPEKGSAILIWDRIK